MKRLHSSREVAEARSSIVTTTKHVEFYSGVRYFRQDKGPGYHSCHVSNLPHDRKNDVIRRCVPHQEDGWITALTHHVRKHPDLPNAAGPRLAEDAFPPSWTRRRRDIIGKKVRSIVKAKDTDEPVFTRS